MVGLGGVARVNYGSEGSVGLGILVIGGKRDVRWRVPVFGSYLDGEREREEVVDGGNDISAICDSKSTVLVRYLASI